jgi:HrpA-like RNA helicase
MMAEADIQQFRKGLPIFEYRERI